MTTTSSISSSSYEVLYMSSSSTSTSLDNNNTLTISTIPKIKTKTIWEQLSPKHNSRLYYELMKSKCDTYVLVEDWYQAYSLNNVYAINDLCQFFVDVAAYQHINVSDWLDEHTMEELISHMEENQSAVLKKTGKYLLKIRDKSYLQRHEKIASFIEAVIYHSAQENILFETHSFLNRPIQLLERMSISNKRPIKHTGIYFALKYQTALISINSEAKEKIKTLKEKLEHKPENEIILKKIETWKISQQFVYRNTLKLNYLIEKNGFHGDPQLYGMRLECLSELGKWIDIEPDLYLNEITYKHFMKVSYDYDKSVRKTLLNVLTNIIKNHHAKIGEKVHLLLEIIGRHIDDPNLENKIFAVQCLIKFIKYHTIPPKCRDKVFLNIYCIYSPLSSMCGKYLVEKIKANSKGDPVEELLVFLRFATQYRQLHEDHYNASLLVEAVLKWMPSLEDISIYVNLLKNNENIEVEMKQSLIEIMSEVFYQIFTGKCRVTREHMPVADINHDRITDLCNDFISQLPFLLVYYNKKEELKPLLAVIKMGKEMVKTHTTKQ